MNVVFKGKVLNFTGVGGWRVLNQGTSHALSCLSRFLGVYCFHMQGSILGGKIISLNSYPSYQEICAN